jgi:hypothetical protein
MRIDFRNSALIAGVLLGGIVSAAAQGTAQSGSTGGHYGPPPGHAVGGMGIPYRPPPTRAARSDGLPLFLDANEYGLRQPETATPLPGARGGGALNQPTRRGLGGLAPPPILPPRR